MCSFNISSNSLLLFFRELKNNSGHFCICRCTHISSISKILSVALKTWHHVILTHCKKKGTLFCYRISVFCPLLPTENNGVTTIHSSAKLFHFTTCQRKRCLFNLTTGSKRKVSIQKRTGQLLQTTMNEQTGETKRKVQEGTHDNTDHTVRLSNDV